MRTVFYFVLLVSNFATAAYAEFVYAPVETVVDSEEIGKMYPFNVRTLGNYRVFRKAGACEKYLLQRLREESGWSLVRSSGGDVGVKLSKAGGIQTVTCVTINLGFLE